MKRKICLFIILLCFSLPVWSFDAPELSATSAILMDYTTGRVLFQKNPDILYPPASMTKLITLYLTYQAIEEGKLDKTDLIEITETGSSFSRPPRSSLMMLEEGQKVDLLTIMKGVAVSSGNDAAYQLSELVSGTPEAFVEQMNFLMEELGLDKMHFQDPDGWSEYNQVTARQYAQFSRIYIQDYPEALRELHSITQLSYPLPENFAGEDARIRWTRTKTNTNNLLGRVNGVDGLKTGYIDESGFNFTGTALRGNTRLISVVMGIFSEYYSQGIETRARESEALLEYGFAHWKTIQAPEPDLSISLWMADQDQLTPVLEEVPWFTLSDQEMAQMVVRRQMVKRVKAPVDAGTVLGSQQWYLQGELLASSHIIANEDVPKGSFKNRVIDFFPMIFYNLTQERRK